MPLISENYKLEEIFNEIQQCNTTKYLQNLEKFKTFLNQEESFDENFINILNVILFSDKKEIPSKITTFIKKTIQEMSYNSKEKKFLINFCNYLKECIDSKYKNVRKNSIFLISLIQESISNQDVKIKIFEKDFIIKIAHHLFDKESSVRRETIKALESHQSEVVFEKTVIINVYKDIIRYDTSPDVRKEALKNINPIPTTFNAVFEKSYDINLGVRKMFYYNYLPKLSIKDLSLENRILLLKRAFLEREFDAKSIFIGKIRTEFDVSTNLLKIFELFFDTEERVLICLKELLEIFCGSTFFDFNDSFFKEISDFSSFFMVSYLEFKEKIQGRDSLNLPDLYTYAAFLYQKCQSFINKESTFESKNEFFIIQNLFKILYFYDCFTDESRKFLLSICYKILTTKATEEITENTILLCKLVCDSELEVFIGSIISKNIKNENTEMCLLVCKYTMKCIYPFLDIHHAIINEIVMPLFTETTNSSFKSVCLQIIFFFLIKEFKPEFFNILIENLNICENNIEIAVDLYCSNNIDKELIEKPVLEFLKENISNERIPFSLTRILLYNIIYQKTNLNEFDKYFLTNLMNIYYSTQNDKTKQWCLIFFNEYFSISCDILVSVLADVLGNLSNNHKVAMDQCMYWMRSTRYKVDFQDLFYNFLIYLIRNSSKSINYKIFINFLEKIPPNENWDKIKTKKIIYACSALRRKITECSNLGSLLNNLISIDDGEPMDIKYYDEVKADMNIISN
ncbi:subunit G of chromosome condensation condensin complex [Hamiltosporidium tvaerminnensis]|uniref:Subunit G of chromosome condensation condensin complex n=2 Tax=Hamiltosporidium tvaerminnensis TaxID=1176355 RepID=A0A4V2JXP2_9MICR|nr:subunit G of chromosome condensation condensin complex [Hamiltosporidium tvaerminnensis]